MRSTADAIHGSFREFKGDSIEATAEFQKNVMIDALRSLLNLLPDDFLDVGFSNYYDILG
jgi:hypothetical protein